MELNLRQLIKEVLINAKANDYDLENLTLKEIALNLQIFNADIETFAYYDVVKVLIDRLIGSPPEHWPSHPELIDQIQVLNEENQNLRNEASGDFNNLVEAVQQDAIYDGNPCFLPIPALIDLVNHHSVGGTSSDLDEAKEYMNSPKRYKTTLCLYAEELTN